MKRWWREYFYWNRTERRGTVFLLLLMTVLMGINLSIRWRAPQNEPVSDPEFLALAARFAADTVQNDSGYDEREERTFARHREFSPRGYSPKFNRPAAAFNPNGLPQAEWERLGLSVAQAQSIKRFEEKGGRFYRKEDLKKLYVISEEFYAHIEPFLQFPEQRGTGFSEEKGSNRTEPAEKVDINRADSTQLALLPGISPKMARRMLKVRETFGGFHSVEQLKDFNGFYAPQYEKLLARAYAGPVSIKPLNLNYCTFKELMAVPGLNYEMAKAILNHRERNGFFKKADDLATLNLAEPGLYAKIAPYLAVK